MSLYTYRMSKKQSFKSTPESWKRDVQALWLPLLLAISGWSLYTFNKSEFVLNAALYATILSVFALARVLFVHLFHWGESQPLPWYSSPFIFIVPALLTCFYFMFW